MHRVEGVAGVLKWLTVVALAATVEPNRDQREEGEALLTQLNFGAEDVHGIHQTTEELDIDPIQGEELAQEAPPLPTAEEIENEHREHTGAVVIHHAEGAKHSTNHHNQRHRQHVERPLLLLPRLLHTVDAEEAEQQRPDDVLVDRIEPGAAVHEVKRNLGKQCKYKHAAQVLLEIVRMEVALDGHEGENREGEATYAGQPFLRRQERRPEVIHEHEGHGDDVKCRRTQVEMSGLVQLCSPFTMLQISGTSIRHPQF